MIMEFAKNYEKYRWIFTSNKKLVIGGKSAEQNEKLIKEILKSKKNFLVMHTAKPGSPFAVIVEKISKVKAKDLKEAAVFCASYSQDYRDNKGDVLIHIFKTKDIYKRKGMKIGTFGVKKFKIITAKKEDIGRFRK